MQATDRTWGPLESWGLLKGNIEPSKEHFVFIVRPFDFLPMC